MFDNTFRTQWPEIWQSLSTEQGRVLDQVLTGYCLLGRRPTRLNAQAVADYMTSKLSEREYQRRLGRTTPPDNRRSAHQIRRQQRLAWQPEDTEEL